MRRHPLGTVVVLHGKGGDASHAFRIVHVDDHVAPTGLAIASVDAGDFYYHRRRSGVDTGAMVLDDLLPLLARHGLAVRPVGFLGWSMGAYGSLRLAGLLGRQRVFGVVAESAALWQRAQDSAPGAFDDPADFARHDVFAARSRLRGIPVRLDCGTGDSFVTAIRAYASGLPRVTATFDAGAHTASYWAGHAGPQLRWLAARSRSRGAS